MSEDKQKRRLTNFQVNHHESVINYYKEKMEWWRVQTDVEKMRCKGCWLRIHQCYCHELQQKRAKYQDWIPKPNIKVCMYYNAVEIARSANTAHVLEATCPDIVYSIIQGDLEKEKELMDDIEREFKENCPQTCIMFPTNEAKLLSEWMGSRPAEVSNRPIRLVMLDGTFPGASRIAKYMINCCALRGVPAPLVKLDLEGGACKSALAGMMYQPGKDKICTYQATVMAMEQAHVDPTLCKLLHNDLRDWIGYILTAKVKLGKTQPRNSMKNVMDISPNEFIAETLKQTKKALSGDNFNNNRDKHASHRSNLKKKLRKGLYLPVQVTYRNPLLTIAVEFCLTQRFTVLCYATGIQPVPISSVNVHN